MVDLLFFLKEVYILFFSPEFFHEFEADIVGKNQKLSEINLPSKIKKLLKEFKTPLTRGPLVDYFIPILISEIKGFENPFLGPLMEWQPFGRKPKKFLTVFVCTSRTKNKINKFYTHPLFDKKRPIILDTSLLYKDVTDKDKYFSSFLEFFIRGREVIIPSLSLYELFTNKRWKSDPTIFVRELKDVGFSTVKIETKEPLSVLTLFVDIQNRKKLKKKFKDKLNSIRDVDILQICLEKNGVLVTADESLHKFAFLLGVPSIRYLGRKFILEIIENSELNEMEKKKIIKEIDEWFLGIENGD